ncbi:MAG: Ig-like domain-containing protein [Gammaproteobacteria bacterium]|nr:Ig-like domain-containing protein [Gammaproteobacteria bacterium]MDH5799930.1 Ig-like domain-containing protein [Gammaproteobacteria bacterium]
MRTKITMHFQHRRRFYLYQVMPVILLALTVVTCYDSGTQSAPPPVPPPAELTIGNDTLSLPPDSSGVVSVLDNDSSSSGHVLGIDSFDSNSTQGGSVIHEGGGRFTYTPVTGFTGEDRFNYIALDPDGTKAEGTVVITVSTEVIPNGRAFYAAKCAICHAAGVDDTSRAFNASDLALKSMPLSRNLSLYGGPYELMGAFNNIPQNKVDELRAYFASL